MYICVYVYVYVCVCVCVQVSLDHNERVLDVLDSKPDSRRIKIKSIASDRNLAEMATEIAQKCKYIHPSRVEEVEQLLIKLNKSNKQREQEEAAAAERGSSSRRGKDSDRESVVKEKKSKDKDRDREKSTRKKKAEEDKYPPADMENLDDYLELLYQVSGKSDSENEEALKAQVEGTAMILKLCRSVVNLEILIQNNTVMGALTRVLQEEFKKSVELTFNILRFVLP
jgi:hypothetical protein